MAMFRLDRELTPEVQEQIPIIADYARKEGLDFFPTIFEPVTAEEMSMLAAYGGFPQRYPHWRFGMEFERMRKQHGYGLGKIYEMVINTDPCYAYLVDDNEFTDQKTVIAHVYAHCDFFKNNMWFSRTNRSMMNNMANMAARIRRHIDNIGADRVERFIDDCLAIENLIDPHSVFITRGSSRPERPLDDKDPNCNEAVTRFGAKDYMDRFINPKSRAARERDDARKQKEEERSKDPKEPRRDVMLFLLNRAPLEDWQSDILSIIRDESYYYAPQGQTKVMNEGWASYWHSTMMTKYVADASDIITYCAHNAGVMASPPGNFNPYKVGVELFRDIEDRWNRGAHGLEYDDCDDLGLRQSWGRDIEAPPALADNTPGRKKIFEVRRLYNDVQFIDEFLTPEFVEKHDMYQYRTDPETGKLTVVNRDFDAVKQQFLFMLANHGQPYIYVTDANYGNRGELCLEHKREFNVDVEAQWAADTLKAIRRIWGRPVNLFAIINDERVLMHVDNDGKVTANPVGDDTPAPAHSV